MHRRIRRRQSGNGAFGFTPRRRASSNYRVAKTIVTGGLSLGASLVAYSALGQRIDIIDEDTIRRGTERVRLWGYDAPERRQSCMINGIDRPIGEEATEGLKAILAGGELRCQTRDVDRYGRTVAECWAGDQRIGDAMVRGGWAWALPRYSGNAFLSAQEEAERTARDVWAGQASCEAPARFRKEHQNRK